MSSSLKRVSFQNDDYIYREGEDANDSNKLFSNNSIVFFIKEGSAGYVLPRYDNRLYLEFLKG